jgi:hypothetical protein
MATYDYYKEHMDMIKFPTLKPGSNWVHVEVDFSKQNMQANDVLRLFKIKDHWIMKTNLGRRITASDGNATSDIGTSSGGQEIDAAFDQQAGATTWALGSVGLDDAPVAVTADGYVFFENLTAACTSGRSEFLFEIVIPHTEVGSETNVSGE